MAIAQVTSQFKVNQVPRLYKTDVRFNISKRRELILYKTASDKDNINLSYVINKEPRPENNVSILDLSTALAANNLSPQGVETIFTGKTIVLQTDKFLVTDQFITLPSGQKRALYYKHVLQNFDSDNPDLMVGNIFVLNSSFDIIDTFLDVSFDMKRGNVYSNLVNKYDAITGEYQVYYIKYTVKNIATQNIISYVEILNNESTYRHATFEDLTDDGRIPYDLQVYTTDEYSSNAYEVTLQEMNTYAVKRFEDTRIKLLPPPSNNINNPWFVSVSNSTFYTTLNITPTTTNIFKYTIPEYNTQLFAPFAPFKSTEKENSFRVNDSLIKTLYGNIHVDAAETMNVLIVARNPDGTPRLAITSNPAHVGLPFETIPKVLGIRSIDKLNGIIDLQHNILETDILEVSYFYSEKNVQIIDIDFNPITNTSIIGKRIVFYIVPSTNNSRFKSIFYLIVDHKGLILSSSQADNAGLTADIATNNFYYDRPSVLPNLNFKDKYTVQAVDPFIFSNPFNPKYLILGEVITTESSHPSESVLIDVRKQGGGIKDEPGLLKSLAPSIPELQWINDAGRLDGFPYPGTAAFLCEVPTRIQKQFGGLFSDLEIREIVERHMAFGEYPAIRGYSTNVLITVEPITDTGPTISFKLNWRSYGASKRYNVYYSDRKDGNFIKANSTPIVDNTSGNTYTVNGTFTLDREYWFYVIECDTNNIDYPEIVIGTTSRFTFENINKVNVKTYSLPT